MRKKIYHVIFKGEIKSRRSPGCGQNTEITKINGVGGLKLRKWSQIKINEAFWTQILLIKYSGKHFTQSSINFTENHKGSLSVTSKKIF